MKDFRNLNNLTELKQSLQELKGENINLLEPVLKVFLKIGRFG